MLKQQKQAKRATPPKRTATDQTKKEPKKDPKTRKRSRRGWVRIRDINNPRIHKKSLWRGVNKNGVSNFLRSIGHFFFVRSNCWGPVTSEIKCVWAPKPCIMRSFGLKMQQKQVRETLFLRENCRLLQRLLNNAKKFVNQKCPQYCWESHDQLSETLSRTTSEKKEASPAVLRGREVWKGLGVPSRTPYS